MPRRWAHLAPLALALATLALTWLAARGLADPAPAAALRTVLLSGLAAGIALALGLAYALALELGRPPGRRALVALGLLPLLLPPYLGAVGWVELFGPAGWVARALGRELPRGPSLLAPGWVYTLPSAALLLGGCLFSLPLLGALAALRRVPAGALEAARLARGAAGERRLLLALALPGALPGALAVVALVAVELAVPQLLRVQALSELVHARFEAEGDVHGALRAALPLVTLGGGAALVALTAWLRRPPLPEARPLERPAPGPGARALASIVCTLALLPGLLGPLIALALGLLRARAPGTPGGLARTWHVIGLAWGIGARDAANSLGVGLAAAAIGAALALLLAWPLRRAGPRLLAPAAGGALALAALPPSLLAIGLLLALSRPALTSLLDSLGVVVAAALARFLPLAALLAWVALRAVPPAQEEAARLAGRRPLAALLPQVAPALAAAALLLHALTTTEFAAAALLAPPGKPLLAVFVVNEAHYGQGAELTGLCVLLLATVALPVPLALALGAAARKGWRRWA